MKLTEQEKRIKIAESCGWEWKDAGTGPCWHRPTGEYRGRPLFSQLHTKEEEAIFYLPDYFNDLNACHEMEKFLVDWVAYRILLSQIVGIGYAPDLEICDDIKSFLSATASQRAEAFGLTMGLWKEGE